MLIRQFRRQFVEKLGTTLGEDFGFVEDGQPIEGLVRESHIFPNFEVFTGRNMIYGNQDGYQLAYSDATLNAQPDKTSYLPKTLFKGHVFVWLRPFDIPEDIWLLPKNTPQNHFNPSIGLPIEGITEVDPHYSRYNYYSRQPEVARPFLEDSFIGKLYEVNRKLRELRYTKKDIAIYIGKYHAFVTISFNESFLEMVNWRPFNDVSYVHYELEPLNLLLTLFQGYWVFSD